MSSRIRTALTFLAVTALPALACSGTIVDDAAQTQGSGATATGGTSGTASGGSGGSGKAGAGGKGGTSGKGGGSSGTTGDPPEKAGVTQVTRVARLTHSQYQNTVNDLFGIDDASAAAFAPDALNGFGFDTSIDLHVDSRLGPQYRAAAESLAQKAVSDDATFQRIVTCNTTESTCSRSFITSFGQRAFRRPLTAAEITRFEALFAEGPTLVGSADAFKDGVALVVEAMLQSPQFLYRTETGDKSDADGTIPLDSYAMASRLSYFLWNTMPDSALFGDAESGGLASAEQLATAAARLVADARATNVAVSFHDQAWAFSRFSRITPDAKTYPKAPNDFATRATDAAHLFVGDIVKNDGGLHELLTAPYAFADSALAPLYGKTVSGNALTRIDFDATERQGILMQVGFLASNAYSIKTDPIHRGLFVVRNLLCVDIPEPPAGASQTPPPKTDTPPKTTRGEVALLTGQDNCRGCHMEINPPGFAFEGFDAVGQRRTTEDGEAIDTTGTMTIGDAPFSFETPFQMVNAVANSPAAQACYAGKWLSFAYGRNLASADAASQASVGELGAGAGTNGERTVREIMLAVTQTPSFRRRAANEVAP